MADDRYVIEWVRGVRMDRYTKQNFLLVETRLGRTLVPVQGSYNGTVVAASAGTHAGGGALDISVSGMSATTVAAVVKALRRAGFAAWYRPYRAGVWNAHIHCILIGNAKMSYGAALQVRAYRNFRDGLASNYADSSWHPDPIVNAVYTVPSVFKPRYYYVTAERLTPHSTPVSTTSNVISGALAYGSKLYVRGIKVVSGTTWGWTLRATGKAWWILEDRTSTTPPLLVAGTVHVGTHNCAAQAQGHASTWVTRAPRIVRRWAASGAQMIMLQEAGTNDTTWQRHLDDALASESRSLVRVNGGGHWRQIVRDTATTKYVAGRLTTLKTHVDSDGCQVFTVIAEVAGVRASFTTLHFDLGATAAQKEALAEQAWAEAKDMADAHDVHWMNRTIGGDTNDMDGVVDRVMASHGLVSGFATAPTHRQADKRTTNAWTNEWRVGPQRDKVYMPAGAALDFEQELAYVESDHNYVHGTRRLYRVAAN